MRAVSHHLVEVSRPRFHTANLAKQHAAHERRNVAFTRGDRSAGRPGLVAPLVAAEHHPRFRTRIDPDLVERSSTPFDGFGCGGEVADGEMGADDEAVCTLGVGIVSEHSRREGQGLLGVTTSECPLTGNGGGTFGTVLDLGSVAVANGGSLGIWASTDGITWVTVPDTNDIFPAGLVTTTIFTAFDRLFVMGMYEQSPVIWSADLPEALLQEAP